MFTGDRIPGVRGCGRVEGRDTVVEGGRDTVGEGDQKAEEKKKKGPGMRCILLTHAHHDLFQPVPPS